MSRNSNNERRDGQKKMERWFDSADAENQRL